MLPEPTEAKIATFVLLTPDVNCGPPDGVQAVELLQALALLFQV